MQIIRSILCLFLLSLFRYSDVYAQNIIATGKVLSATDQTPLMGANVMVKGATNGVVTAENGSFNLAVPHDSVTLVVSYIGYIPREVDLHIGQPLNILLSPMDSSLNDVIVIGYGTSTKKDLTGSISSVQGKDMDAIPTPDVLQSLSGRAAGVRVMQNTGAPGASISVRIRGTNSVQGSNEPLYVVDGFPLSSSNPIILDNSNIESVEVLKDASATAIYGSRGANGIVLITTKKGRAGKTKVELSSRYTSQTLRKKLDLMDASEYARFYNEVAENDGAAPRFTEGQMDSMGRGFDWQDFVFQRAPMVNTNLTISGGNENTQFAISGSLMKQDGIIRNSGFDRYSIRTSITHKISSKLNVDVVSLLARIRQDNQNSSGSDRGASLIGGTVSGYPTVTPFNPDGSYRVMATVYPWGSNTILNPINFINEMKSSVVSDKVLTTAALSYKPVKQLTFRVLGGIENSNDRKDEYKSTDFIASTGDASVSTMRSTSLLAEGTVNYSNTFGKHRVNAVIGATYQDFETTSLGGSGAGFLNDISETYDLGGAANPGVPSSGYSLATLVSGLGRINYSWSDKYLATVSFRGDGSSRYSEGDKWGFFPSAALAWRLSDEEFLKNLSFVSDLKIRAGWGKTGSQAISPYATLNQLKSGKTVFGDALYTTYAPGTLLPGDLKWETTEQTDFGIDGALFNNRLRFTLDYYIKNTSDLLNTVSLPSSLGFINTIQNVGKMQNKGFEVSADGTVMQGAFNWDVGANISFNRNKVVKLYDGNDVLGPSYNVSLVNDVINILREGEPLGSFYGYLEDGYDDNGQIIFKDLDGNGSIDINDKTIIGNPNPKFTYGFNSAMSFQGFELSLFFQGSYGNDIFNLSSVNNTLDYGYGLNMPREVLEDHWTEANKNAKYPKITKTAQVKFSDRFVENGTYLRLRSVQLSYNIAVDKWKKGGLTNLQVFASGQNLLTFTKYAWWDPEVNSGGGANSINQGIDRHTYPNSKSITLGFRAQF